MYNYIQYFFLYRYMRGIFPADHGNSVHILYLNKMLPNRTTALLVIHLAEQRIKYR